MGPVLQQCERNLEELDDIFWQACSKDEDDRSKRIWGEKRPVVIGRESTV